MDVKDIDLNIWEVGGSVRDRFMGKEPEDEDFVIVGHTVDEVLNAGFEQVVGEDFPVFLDNTGREFAMARTEEKTGAGHQGFEMYTSPEVTLQEDLARRDLTINAMARHPTSEKIVDPFNGRQDLENGILRHTTDAFAEDPLRVLRLARFAARLDFEVADETVWMARQTAPDIIHIASERIAEELLKAFKQAEDCPSRFFRILNDIGNGALNIPFPEVESLRHVPAGPEEHHAEGSAFEHTMRVLDHIKVPGERQWGDLESLYPNVEQLGDSDRVRIRLAALSHDFGKACTPTETLPAHHGHDQAGGPIAERFANRLRLSNEQKGVMVDAAVEHMRFNRLPEMRASKVLNLVERLDRSPTNIAPDELVELSIADNLGREPQRDFDMSEHRDAVAAARQAIDEIGGEEVLAEHPDKNPGEWVGDQILHDRVVRYRTLS